MLMKNKLINIHFKNTKRKQLQIYKSLKIMIYFFILSLIIFINILIIKEFNNLNKNYLITKKNVKLKFYNKLKNQIKIGILCHNIKNGGIERLTALLINYLYNIKLFKIYLFTLLDKEDDEYNIPIQIKRIIILKYNTKNLIKSIIKKKIDIFIYQFYIYNDISMLNKLNKTKTIIYNHSSFFFWIYSHQYHLFNSTYREYTNSKYIISLVPLENDYIFKKWGINSILMNNFITYEYYSVNISNLSSKTIIMIGRASDKLKRFNLGIQAMEYIIKDIPLCLMKIISNITNTNFLQDLINNLHLENNVEFVGYTTKPHIYYENASLHIFSSISESFGLVLSETKIYGIPNILLGIDYTSISKGGTIIIYDDSIESIAKESIKILRNDTYRNKLGNEARLSMKKFNNKLILKKWVKLILSIYNGHFYYQKLRNNDKKISKLSALKILNNQIKILKKRNDIFKNITINDILNLSFLQNLNNKNL